MCGLKGPDHKCMNELEIPVGAGVEGYNTIINTFKNYQMGCHARAVLLNPLHRKLPKIAVVVHPSCNKFDHMFVSNQQAKLDRLYKEHLEDVLGPIIGGASDGDSRRRKLHLLEALSEAGHRHQPVPLELGFLLTCRVEKNDDDGSYIIRELADQDFVHNVKKLVNPLDHDSRNMHLGDYMMIHMNHLRLVQGAFDFDDYGLADDDINRKDRQNYRSAQKILFKSVQNCLQKICDGNGVPANPGVLGTKVYLEIAWRYCEIFKNPGLSLEDRIMCASVIVTFLGIWQNFVQITPGLITRHNFISRERCTDMSSYLVIWWSTSYVS